MICTSPIGYQLSPDSSSKRCCCDTSDVDGLQTRLYGSKPFQTKALFWCQEIEKRLAKTGIKKWFEYSVHISICIPENNDFAV